MSRDFWSRRRAGVQAEALAEEEARASAAQAREARRLEERPDEEILAELGLPEPEAMERPEQVQDLLRAAVPQRLRARALRRLWRLNPVLANVDGLVDYGQDFTDAAMVVENLQTAYQVGKGMLSRFEALAEAPAEPAAGAAAAGGQATGPEPGEETPHDRPDETPDEMPDEMGAELAAARAPPPPEPDEAPAARAPARRMQFQFDAAT